MGTVWFPVTAWVAGMALWYIISWTVRLFWNRCDEPIGNVICVFQFDKFLLLGIGGVFARIFLLLFSANFWNYLEFYRIWDFWEDK